MLLTGTGGEQWLPAAKAVAAELGVPLTCYADANGLANAYRLSAGAAMLVRPDGFIAWRTDSAEDSQATLGAALRRLLAR